MSKQKFKFEINNFAALFFSFWLWFWHISFLKVERSRIFEKRISFMLEFWKFNENNFSPLGELAKKYLSMPSSPACVERYFSISGHIFSKKFQKSKLNLIFLTV